MTSTRLAEGLDRTLRLMRDELRAVTQDEQLLEALTRTRVVLAADAANLGSHAAQCAFVTAAVLMARSGHQVYLSAPDQPCMALQPPLAPGGIVAALLELGEDLLPGVRFETTVPSDRVDLVALLGDTPPPCSGHQVVSLNATAWAGSLAPVSEAGPWLESRWPFGALAAGALTAGEAFKHAMRSLSAFGREPRVFGELMAANDRLHCELAPEDTPQVNTLGAFQAVSAGAIIQAVLYCLARIPEVSGQARLIEDSSSDLSNLNRYALLRRSNIPDRKLDTLGALPLGGLTLELVPLRYNEDTRAVLLDSTPVLVGVDHIPTRWLVQGRRPPWLGVGATTHWNAMSSFHVEGVACAACLHPRDDLNDAPIPTVALVSFWAGLLLSTLFVRSLDARLCEAGEQCEFFTPLRPESRWRTGVAPRVDCPICGKRRVATG